jgi:hypothetical protein
MLVSTSLPVFFFFAAAATASALPLPNCPLQPADCAPLLLNALLPPPHLLFNYWLETVRDAKPFVPLRPVPVHDLKIKSFCPTRA